MWFFKILLVCLPLNIVLGSSLSKHNLKKKNFAFVITNNSTSDKFIKLNGTEGFFGSIDQLTSFINKRYADTLFPHDYQKAWRFMADYTWTSGLPLTHQSWYHQVLVFINSAGWGICDDKAEVLAKIWLAMGYKSRIWQLDGHVVPEIYVNTHWEMWYPHFQVFYKNPDQKIMGVEDLFQNNSIITSINYDHRIKLSIWTLKMGFSKKTARLYTHSDTKISYEPVQDTITYNYSEFLLPKNGTLVFPVYKPYPLKKTSYGAESEQKNYAQLMLNIEKGWTGKISYPLIFHALTSDSAEVLIDGHKHLLSKANNTVVPNVFSAQSPIKIIHNDKGINLFFLINPRLFTQNNNFKHIRNTLKSEDVNIYTVSLSLKETPNMLYLDELNRGDGVSYFKTLKYLLREYMME